MKQINAKVLKTEIEAGKIEAKDVIDVRSFLERLMKKIPGTTNITMSKLFVAPEKYLEKNHTYYIICASGMRSLRVSQELEKKGFKVVNVKDGIMSY